MVVATAKITMNISWARSLKDKRMVVKSIVTKVKDRFNVSIAEVEHMDAHKTLVLGVAGITGSTQMADSVLDHVICFIENRTDAEITHVEREMR